MGEARTADLAAWLTAIWDEEERLANRYVVDVAAMQIDNYGHLTVPAHWVLARIAADRKILALHKATDWCGPTELSCEICHEDYSWGPDHGEWPCATLKALASAYAARPDAPEWLVERQGVEG